MKKWNKVLLAVLAVASVFAFGACDEDVCEKHVDENKDGVCDNCEVTLEQTEDGDNNGDEEEESGVTAQVSAEVWQQTLTWENRNNYSLLAITEIENLPKNAFYMAKDDNFEHILLSEDDAALDTLYWDTSTTPIKQYRKDADDTYALTYVEETELARYGGSYETLLATVASSYESATYDAQKAAYDCVVQSGTVSYHFVVKFVDGKLHSAIGTADYEMNGLGAVHSSITYTFDDIALVMPTV